MLKTFNLSNFGLPVLGTIASLAIAAPSHAVTFTPFTATYNFNNSAARFAPTITGTNNLTGNNISSSGFTTTSTPTTGGVGNTALLAGTGVDNTDFLTFTLSTPGKTLPLDLSTFTLFASKSGTTGPLTLFTSLDSFAAGITGTPVVNGTLRSIAFDVSGVAFDNIAAPITFRIAAGTAFSNSVLKADDVTVAGQIAVPYEFETAAGVLLFAGYFVGKRYLKNKAVFKA